MSDETTQRREAIGLWLYETITGSMDEYELGRKAGEDAARNAWTSRDFLIRYPNLPANHSERKVWLAGFARGLAEYNAKITVN